MSNSINGWDDLRRFGITMLTGEACGIGLRLLCDLDEHGIKMVSAYLGGNVTFLEGSGWSGGEASVMLPRYSWTDLAVFCLLTEYQHALIMENHGVIGLNEADMLAYQEDAEWYREHVKHTYSRSGTAAGGLRNKHVCSGRVS